MEELLGYLFVGACLIPWLLIIIDYLADEDERKKRKNTKGEYKKR